MLGGTVSAPHDRVSALRALLAYELPVDAALAELSRHSWDVAEPLVTLTALDILKVIDRYLGGELSSSQVTDWADLVECRDDIDYPKNEHEFLSAIIFRLANPNLEGEVSIQLAEKLKGLLLSREPNR
jgi:hypothetical protein